MPLSLSPKPTLAISSEFQKNLKENSVVIENLTKEEDMRPESLKNSTKVEDFLTTSITNPLLMMSRLKRMKIIYSQ